MKSKSIVFSLIHEQSVFMTAIMAMLTFLSVLALGIALSIGTGVIRWNSQWDLIATVQITNSSKTTETEKILNSHKNEIAEINKISNEKMKDLMQPWISGGTDTLERYLPIMYEIKFNSKQSLEKIGKELSKHSRFLTHADALKTSTSAGWKMIILSSFVLILILATIGICISYIVKNTALLHRRELEILNQIGASDNFIAKQMQIITGKICMIACFSGFIIAIPILLLILSTAHSTRVGLMSMLAISNTGWVLLILLPILIIIFSIYITKRTTLNILKNT